MLLSCVSELSELTEPWGLLLGCSSAFTWNGGKLPGLAGYKEDQRSRNPEDSIRFYPLIGWIYGIYVELQWITDMWCTDHLIWDFTMSCLFTLLTYCKHLQASMSNHVGFEGAESMFWHMTSAQGVHHNDSAFCKLKSDHWGKLLNRFNRSLKFYGLVSCDRLWHVVIVVLTPKLIIFWCRLDGNLSATLQELHGP